MRGRILILEFLLRMLSLSAMISVVTSDDDDGISRTHLTHLCEGFTAGFFED